MRNLTYSPSTMGRGTKFEGINVGLDLGQIYEKTSKLSRLLGSFLACVHEVWKYYPLFISNNTVGHSVL